MRAIREFENLFIHRNPVDMRKSINGLSVIVQDEMGLDVRQRSLFIFCNRRRTHMKILYFDRSGFALWFKRLEESKFPWPRKLEEDVISVSRKDLELLLEGVNIWSRFEKVHFEEVI